MCVNLIFQMISSLCGCSQEEILQANITLKLYSRHKSFHLNIILKIQKAYESNVCASNALTNLGITYSVGKSYSDIITGKPSRSTYYMLLVANYRRGIGGRKIQDQSPSTGRESSSDRSLLLESSNPEEKFLSRSLHRSGNYTNHINIKSKNAHSYLICLFLQSQTRGPRAIWAPITCANKQFFG